MQITNILIWQINDVLRNFTLEENKVNVITGESGTGKSSILAIIDYCLLSSTSEGLSKTNIDNHVKWYGIRFHINDKFYTICRKSTHYRKDEIYFDRYGGIPKTPENNIKKDTLKQNLNYEFCIDPSLKIPYGGKFISQGSKVTYRYFLPHCFIEQATLQSTDNLYSKISDPKIRERIDRTFDMALGSEDAKTMITRIKLEGLQKKLKKFEDEQSKSKEPYVNFENEIESLYEESCRLDLTSDKNKYELTKINKFEHLKTIVNYKDDEIPIAKEKLNVENQIYTLKKELREINDYIETSSKYKNFLKENQDSLLIAQYLDDHCNEIIYTKNIYSIVKSLLNQSLEIKKAIKEKGGNSLISKTLDKKKELEDRILLLSEKLSMFNDEITPSMLYRFIGKLSVKIEQMEQSVGSDYADDIEKIKDEIKKLDLKVEDGNLLKELARYSINEKIKNIFSRMHLKGFEEAIPNFNKAKKTLDLFNKDQVEKMVDIGSASNYMYIHIAYFLALHELVRKRNVKWVPKFLIIDQPSTPYFSTGSENADDFARLDAALNEINSFVEQMKSYGGFQIILLEHIEESYWSDKKLNNFRLVDREFRDNYGLIYPKES